MGRGFVDRVVVLNVRVNSLLLSDFALRFRPDRWILVYIQIAFVITRNQTRV